MGRRKPTENPKRQWGAVVKTYKHGPLRKGETSRRCERCGREYMPNSRSQRYCDECRRKR